MTTPAKVRQVVHGDFTIERHYPASPTRVFGAFTSLEAKKQWFGAPDEHNEAGHELDFRVGGVEVNIGKHAGTTYRYVAIIMDLVPNERIVSSYEMYANDDRISVSIAAYEFIPEGDGCRLVLVEHGAFLDGFDTIEQRHEGTEQLLNSLGDALVDGRV